MEALDHYLHGFIHYTTVIRLVWRTGFPNAKAGERILNMSSFYFFFVFFYFFYCLLHLTPFGFDSSASALPQLDLGEFTSPTSSPDRHLKKIFSVLDFAGEIRWIERLVLPESI